MSWFGRFTLLVVAVGGFAAAHVFVQTGNAMEAPVPTVTVPTLTVPTLTVPTVPVPTAPVPTATTPTVPVPVPSTPTPTVSVPTTPSPPPVQLPPVTSAPVTAPAPEPRPAPRPATTTVPAEPRASSGSSTPPSGGSSAPRTSDAPSGGAARGAPPATARSTSSTSVFQAKTHRTPSRVSVRLAFVLPEARRLFLIVRGPAPSCKVAGFIPVRGRKGANTVYFSGRVHGRRLEPGVYLISLSPNRRPVPGAATEYVRVVSPKRSLPLPERARKPSCSEAGVALPTDAIERTMLAGAIAKASTSRPTARIAGAAVESPTGDENDDGASGLLPDSGVLGAATDGADEEPFLAIALLAVVAALLLAMLALVTRFLRGSWDP